MKGLKTRATSAFFFAIIMLLGLFYNELSYKYLFVFIAIGCVYELLNINIDSNEWIVRIRLILYSVVGTFPILYFLYTGSLHIGDCTPWIMVGISILLLIELFAKSEKPFQNVALVALSIFYISMPIVGLLQLSQSGALFSKSLGLGLLLLTWSNDTGAYFAGSNLGKHKIFPRISPNKTWEGTIGGIVLCIFVGMMISRLLTDYTLIDWVVFSIIVGILGSLGDLVQSMLKRSLGIKDSGNILPGHGGFLDRFDAFIFILPFVYTYVQLLK
jgi:phosphatidate cytidylyltransferase